MIIYVALALFPICFGLFFPKLHKSKRQKRWFYFICGTVTLLAMGLRHYSLGSTDTLNYYNAMKRALMCDSWEQFYIPVLYEKGSQFFIYTLSRIFNDPQWLLVISSLIFIIGIFYFVDHNSEDIPLSITLYLTLGLMLFHVQGLRQSLAMSICLFAYEQAKDKHLIRFALLVWFATAFHQTAIVFFPIYFLCRMKYSRKNLLIMCIATILVVSNATRIIEMANTYFDRTYTDTVEQGGFVSVFIYAIILILTLVFDRQIKNNSSQTPLLYILIVGFATYIMRYFGAVIAERISFYFVFAQLALLPNATKIFVKKDRPAIRLIIIVLAVALMAYRLNGSEFVPYMFFWEGP